MWNLNLLQNIELGVKNLLLHKLRSLLTMLGIVFGVASVIAMLSIGEGASKQALDDIRSLGSTNIIINAQKPTEDEAAATVRTFMSIYGLLYDDEVRIRESFDTVEKTVPVKAVRKEGRLYERALELRIVGTNADWFALVERPMIAGRALVRRDIDSLASVCVLTEYGARRLLATRRASVFLPAQVLVQLVRRQHDPLARSRV